MKKNKKKVIIIISIIIILLLISIITLVILKNKKKKNDIDITNNSSLYKINDNALDAFDLYFLQSNNKNKNVIYSPLSIKYALSMLSDASTNQTHTEIANILGNFEAKKYENSQNLSLANAMFIKDSYKKSIKDTYINLIKNNYNAQIIYDSFESANNINKWVKNKTLGLIDNLLDDTDGLDFLLINALAIDMEWKNVLQPVSGKEFFDEKHTYDGTDFSVSYAHEEYGMYIGPIMCDIYSKLKFNNKTDVKAIEIGSSINNYDILGELGEQNIRKTVGEAYEEWVLKDECNQGTYESTNSYLDHYIKEIDKNYKDVATSTDYSFYIDDDIKVFQKDLKEYDGLSLEYIAFMPRKTSLDKFIDNINKDELNDYISKLKTIKLNNFEKGKITRIKGLIPLYKFFYELDLKNNLKDLGIKSVFEPSYASLNNLTNKDAYISEILHKANIDFSNEGIKAAAATEGGGAGDTNCGFDYLYEVPVEEIDITFDLPFMFILRDKNSKEVWFMGSVYEPTEYSESSTCR